MNEVIQIVAHGALVGVGATVLMDLWGAFQKRVLGAAPLNYCLLGRWIGHFQDGQFVHEHITRSQPVRGECAIGWSAHYAIGITFAVLLLAIWGLEWAYEPTLPPALLVGIVTVAAPFFLMQPGMGAGIAASKTPHPN